jgi:hypothetical protein
MNIKIIINLYNYDYSNSKFDYFPSPLLKINQLDINHTNFLYNWNFYTKNNKINFCMYYRLVDNPYKYKFKMEEKRIRIIKIN